MHRCNLTDDQLHETIEVCTTISGDLQMGLPIRARGVGIASALRELLDRRATEATESPLRELERGIAYTSACSIIESNLGHSGTKGADRFDWYDTGSSDDEWAEDEWPEQDIAEAVRYLDLRRLLDHHPDNPNWVRLRDEGEPLPAPREPAL